MKDSTIKVLDNKDMEFVEGLKVLGAPRIAALLITFLSSLGEANSREIEHGTGLRQPEISVAVRFLRNDNWIDERRVKTNGKGRPMKIYALKLTRNEIINHFEEQMVLESTKSVEAVKRLRELSAQ